MSRVLRLLLTRPAADARAFALKLRARGWTPILCPMLDVVFCKRACPRFPPHAVLAFTSANGVRALRASVGRASAWRGLLAHRVFAVGEATAAAARAAGFLDVVESDGDSHALAARLCQARPPFVAHISGRAGAGLLAKRLREKNIRARTHIFYAAPPRRHLPPPIVRQLLGGRIEGALFFSARTASAFRAAVRAHGQAAPLQRALAHLPAFCLAEAAAARLSALMPTYVAAAPSGAALLDEVHKQLG